MTREDIIDMAREAGFDVYEVTPTIYATSECSEELARFATLVAAQEREACAKVCDESAASIWPYHDEIVKQTGLNVCENLAATIRARIK